MLSCGLAVVDMVSLSCFVHTVLLSPSSSSSFFSHDARSSWRSCSVSGIAAARVRRRRRASAVTISAKAPDVVIVGGGAAGLSTAVETALMGANVTVLSRSSQEAALNASAGMLAPNAEQMKNPSMHELAKISRNMFPEYAKMLHRLSGCHLDAIAYRSRGDFLVPRFLDEENVGFPFDCSGAVQVGEQQLRYIEPALGPDVVAATCIEGDAHVNSRELMNVLHSACIKLGVEIRSGVDVASITLSADGSAVDSVLLTSGEQVVGGHYILCAGAWTKQVLPSIPIKPIKGQMLCLEPRDSFPGSVGVSTWPHPSHTLFRHELYVVPKADGRRFYVGATVEDVGFDNVPTAGGVCDLLQRAIRLVPAFSGFRIVESWAGLRPATPDLVPILGRLQYRNMSIAGGYYRNGVLLMPATAKIAAAVALDAVKNLPDRLAQLLPHFSCTRFFGSRQPEAPTPSKPQPRDRRDISEKHDGGGPQRQDVLNSTAAEVLKKYPTPPLYHVRPDGSQVPVTPWSLPSVFTRGYGDTREEDKKEQGESEFDIKEYLRSVGLSEDEDEDDDVDELSFSTHGSDSSSTAASENQEKVDPEASKSGGIDPTLSPRQPSSSSDKDIVSEPGNVSKQSQSASIDREDDDAYNDLLRHRGEEAERLMSEALAKNRAFGRVPHSTEGPILSVSADEWKRYEDAMNQGLNDMKEIEHHFREDDPGAIATALEAELEESEGLNNVDGVTLSQGKDEGDRKRFVGHGYY